MVHEVLLVILVCGSRRHHISKKHLRLTVRLGHDRRHAFVEHVAVLLLSVTGEVCGLGTRVARLVLSVLQESRRQPAKTFRHLRLLALSRIVIEAVVMRINRHGRRFIMLTWA
jgi:hypothetical protein